MRLRLKGRCRLVRYADDAVVAFGAPLVRQATAGRAGQAPWQLLGPTRPRPASSRLPVRLRPPRGRVASDGGARVRLPRPPTRGGCSGTARTWCRPRCANNKTSRHGGAGPPNGDRRAHEQHGPVLSYLPDGSGQALRQDRHGGVVAVHPPAARACASTRRRERRPAPRSNHPPGRPRWTGLSGTPPWRSVRPGDSQLIQPVHLDGSSEA